MSLLSFRSDGSDELGLPDLPSPQRLQQHDVSKYEGRVHRRPLYSGRDQFRFAPKCRDGPILLQKSFWGVEQKLLEPLTRFARGDVRDHIDGSKIYSGAPNWR